MSVVDIFTIIGNSALVIATIVAAIGLWARLQGKDVLGIRPDIDRLGEKLASVEQTNTMSLELHGEYVKLFGRSVNVFEATTQKVKALENMQADLVKAVQNLTDLTGDSVDLHKDHARTQELLGKLIDTLAEKPR